MSAGFTARPLLGRRSATVLAALGLGVIAWFQLGLTLDDLLPDPARGATARAFATAALHPAFDYQGDFVPAAAPPFWRGVAAAALRTVVFAAGGMFLAVIGGLVLGMLASASWWRTAGAGPLGGRLRPVGLVAARVTIAGLRSVHELLWAVLFLAALGVSPAAGAIAIAIPYAGTLAKVFSEQVDEVPRDASRAMGALGAGGTLQFTCGLLPRAARQMASFTFYQFECSVRAAAVLGFFGFPTLGQKIAASFANGNYGEVWSYLYALIALVLTIEMWSARLRSGRSVR
ncbi:PhnE/PtxC family ABC transporter permease [Engelhardtia mirabilis]|uniref:Phosphate-import permease protein PhnE n=1 Tax=Engelhardtia mirabilis TaxID=2528011 RepID=A0A518BNM4_9BACT|nr:Phosphate-import permease protein PhnE [Planctomycetes bacterium Pla133]QDV02903.1 Phosphate-import permease protein PhnE [Planctomycetes bacterium Pla86]